MRGDSLCLLFKDYVSIVYTLILIHFNLPDERRNAEWQLFILYVMDVFISLPPSLPYKMS
jgi:hypothetical protein